MKFRYKKYGPGIIRPVIPVELTANGVAVPYEVLVDSGADMCVFDAQIAEVLGIDVKAGERSELSGATGYVQPFYIYPVSIAVGGWEHTIKVGFLPNIAKTGYGIVGQKGFFDIFIVKFDYRKEEIELKERN
ncbi:MAG: aspartyl protease family protein [Patescibacteria group bacterium]|nr:aspartyl protease family protein [Patescibacteria group bacterium]